MIDIERVTSQPDICGGDACIAGTRIMVWLLVFLSRGGKSNAELLANYPSLTPDDLDAAWDHFRQFPLEIEQGIWVNTIALNNPPETPVAAWIIVAGQLLGMSDEQICDSFDPPLSQADVDAAWEEYRRRPREIDRDIAHHRIVE
jgi:uncharacterized protein (DUF433 family)